MVNDLPTSTQLDLAHGYLARGWSVFPCCSPLLVSEGRACLQHGDCPSPGKRPLIRWEEFQHRLPTIEEVQFWWTKWPEANIACATGPVSGFVVLDVDSAEGMAEVERRGGVLPGRTVQTGKDHGLHYHLADPGTDTRNFAKRILGCDFRGAGGYVLLPGSQHASGARYQWGGDGLSAPAAALPLWLRELLLESSGPGERAAQAEPLQMVEYLIGLGEGERTAGIFRLASRLRGDGVSLDLAQTLILLAAEKCKPPLPTREALAQLNSAYARYQPNEKEERPVFGAQSLEDLLAKTNTDVEELIEGLIFRNRLHWVYAGPGTGKTLFILWATLHLAAGLPLGERRVNRTNVFWFQEDQPLQGFAGYAESLIEQEDLKVMRGFGLNEQPNTLHLTSAEEYEAACEFVLRLPEVERVWVLDSCEAICPSDRYSSREFEHFKHFCSWLMGRGDTVIVIDHENKPPRSNVSEVDEMYFLYGGGSKSRIADIMLRLKGTAGDPQGIKITWPKFRGEKPPPMSAKYSSVTGWSLVDRPGEITNEAERIVIGWYNRPETDQHRPMTMSAIELNTRLKPKQCRRTVQSLVRKRILLERDGGYLKNHEAGGMP